MELTTIKTTYQLINIAIDKQDNLARDYYNKLFSQYGYNIPRDDRKKLNKLIAQYNLLCEIRQSIVIDC